MKIFENRSQILTLIETTDNHKDTLLLTEKLQQIKKERNPFYLTLNELEEILKWKLRSQFERQRTIRNKNNDTNVRKITETAFSIEHPNMEHEIALKLKLLCCLTGVQIPVASAILTLCFPEKYCVLDFRNWRQIFNNEKEKRNFLESDYIKYWNEIIKLSKYYDLTPQQIDIGIWQKDIKENGKSK